LQNAFVAEKNASIPAMSLLKSSKTWPSVLTMAFVQLRVDQKGRTYSAIINSPTFVKKDNYLPNGGPSATIISNGVIANGTNESTTKVKLSAPETEKSLLAIEKFPDCNGQDKVLPPNSSATANATNEKNGKDDEHLLCHRHHHQLEKQQLSKQQKREKSLRQKQLIRDNRFRSASIKVDNWDYIYREKDLLNGNLR
jgi:hypothetical protein